LQERQPLPDLAVPSQSFPVERFHQRLPALHQKIRRRFNAGPLSQNLMKAADFLPRSLAFDAARKMRLVGRPLLRRKVAIKIERQVLFKLLAVHDHVSPSGRWYVVDGVRTPPLVPYSLIPT